MPFTTPLRWAAGAIALTLLGVSAIAAPQGSAKPITVILVTGGESRVITTTAATVSELLAEQRLTVGTTERLSVPPTTPVTDGMRVAITRPQDKASTPIVIGANPRSGRGGRSTALASRGSLTVSGLNPKRVLSMMATGYGPGENGPWGNRTALGGRVQKGVVAVDPRVIKLGTKLYIEGYGECIAGDTGSAIRGMRIDLAFNTDRVANQFGRRRVMVYVLE